MSHLDVLSAPVGAARNKPARRGARGFKAGKLATDHKLPREHLSAQLSVLAAAEVLLEGLERTGRDLTRDHLIERLEGLRGFEAGFGPPVTFGPVRRLGARGAYILKADLRKGEWVPAGGWVGAE